MTDRVLDTGMGNIDELLYSQMPEFVPEDITKAVTPWKKAVRLILAGIILSLIGAEIFPFGLVTDLAGALLCVMGYRRFCNENRSFRVCMWLSVASLVLVFARIVLTCFSVRFDTVRSDANTVLQVIILVILAAVMIFNARALKAVEAKAGCSINAGNATHAAIWYIVLRALLIFGALERSSAVSGIGHPFVTIVLSLAAFALLMHSMWKLCRELEEPGYAIDVRNPKVPDLSLVVGAAVLCIALYVGGVFARSYPTVWKSYDQSLGSNAEKIGAALSEQGLPKQMLELLTEDELLYIGNGTLRAMDTDEAVTNGRELLGGSGEAPLVVRSYVVENEDAETVIYYFEWPEYARFSGTEGILINNPSGGVMRIDGDEIVYPDEISGRVAAVCGGRTQTAELFVKSRPGLNSWANFSISDAGMYMFSGFSVPHGASCVHGCVVMGALPSDGSITTDMIYVHQKPEFKAVATGAREDSQLYIMNNLIPFSGRLILEALEKDCFAGIMTLEYNQHVFYHYVAATEK